MTLLCRIVAYSLCGLLTTVGHLGCSKDKAASSGAQREQAKSHKKPRRRRKPRTVLAVADPMNGVAQHSAGDEGATETHNVYRLLRQNIAMVNACYARERRREPQLAGKLTVKLTIGPGPRGLVKKAEVTDRTLQSPGLERCVVGSLRAFSFPRKSDESMDVTLPFLFR